MKDKKQKMNFNKIEVTKHKELKSATRKMKPSEWGVEEKLDPCLFVWWDTNEGLVSKQRFEEIKKLVL